MRSHWDNAWFTVPYLIFLALGLTYTLLTPHGAELVAFNQYRAEPLNTFFIYATKLGEPKFVGLLVLAAGAYRFRYGVLMLLAGLFVWPVAYLSKHYIGMPRPKLWLETLDIEHLVTVVPGVNQLYGYHSMPSGHTMLAFAAFGLAALLLPFRYRALGLLFFWTALMVGFSRMFLVQHFLRDVLSGSVFGVLVADLVWQLYRRFWVGR